MMQTHSPTITFKLNDDKDHDLRRISTDGSILESEEGLFDDEEEEFNEKEHAQDWTKATDPKETWAYKERRRASVFGVHDEYDITSTSPTKSKVPPGRRGSILSVWRSGKDDKGRDILVHDDNDLEGEGKEEVVTLEQVATGDSGKEEGKGERKGSILSMWGPGVDEEGRAVITHDDEEWKK